MNLAKITALITNVADFFIPPQIAADPDRRNQARVFLISHLFGPFIGNTVPLALYLVDPNPGYELAVLAASITGFLIFPILLKISGLYRTLAVLSVQNLLFCILWSCYFYGGVTSPTLSWTLIIPLLAFFYIGHSMLMRCIVIGLMIANFITFLSIYVMFPAPKSNIPMAAIETLGIISMMATAAYVSMMAIYFAKVFESQSVLEDLIDKHLHRADELRAATAEAERASAAKADFLANMTHELRTPLNAIIGYSEMLLEEADEADGQQVAEDLRRIHQSGVQLLHLINEILDLAKIDAGKMELFLSDVSPSDVLLETAAEFRSMASQRGNVLNVVADPDLGLWSTDEQKLRQILRQIIDNAVKFTDHGLIVVKAGLITSRAGLKQVRIEVVDTGCGISKNDLGCLFEHFTVLGDTSSSKYGGTGLGLALSRKLARLMGGDIEATSAVGEGSTFAIILPYVQPSQARHADEALAA